MVGNKKAGLINTALNDPITDESVTDSISISPSKPKYKLLDNELKRFVRTSEESSPVAVPEKI